MSAKKSSAEHTPGWIEITLGAALSVALGVVVGAALLALRPPTAVKEKEMPKALHISLDGRSGARNREFDFDLSKIPVSTRTSKGLTVSKWAVKDVKKPK